MSQIQISDKYFVQIKNILRQYFPTAQIWLFGSRITGTAKKYSDLDVLIKAVDNENTNANFIALKYAFEDSDIPFQIDIVDWYKTSLEFREMILKDAIILERCERK